MQSLRWTLAVVFAIAIVIHSRSAPSQEAAKPKPGERPSVASLIDKLKDIDKGDVGYMSTATGSGFLPLGKTQAGAFVLGAGGGKPSELMREIVSRGADAIPDLIAHLDDARPTSLKMQQAGFFDGMFFDDEYDFNRNTTKVAPEGVNRELGINEKTPKEHTVTVGDLCFVALGQIVNRHFNAVRYQPTAIMMINSPTYSERLRKAIKKEWGSLTKEQHKQSLIRDFQQPDFEERRTDAAIRIGYYYPESLEPLVLAQLAQPIFTGFPEVEFIEKKLFPAKDAASRKALLEEFLSKAGPQARAGIIDYLFDDLDKQELEEKARECLVQLFGYPQEVKSDDRPKVVLNDVYKQYRFIEAIARFASPKIDAAVRKVLHATDYDDLARACARYLAGRGADNDIRSYVAKRMPEADDDRKRELARLQEQLGWTPLHVAAEEYDDSRMEELLQKGADINARAENGKTPLHIATESGGFGGMQVLIRHKAKLNLRDKQGQTPIQLGHGYGSAIDILLEAGAEIPDILIAALAGRDDLVKSFLEKDKKLASSRSDNGETPLHMAAQRGHLRVAELLIAAGADVNAVDNDRSKLTPLHWAAIYNKNDISTLLLKHGANRKAKDWSGKTPLDHAREDAAAGKNQETIRLLEK